VETEHSFTLIANDMYMRRTMIVWVNHDAQAAYRRMVGTTQ